MPSFWQSGAACLCLCALSASAQELIWKGHSEDFTVVWTTNSLKAFRTAAPAQPVLDFRKVAEADWKELSADPLDKNITAVYDYRVLSLAGAVLSIEEDDYCDCGGAHPIAGKLFRAIDLSRSQPAKAAPAQLTSLFPSETVFQALLADSAVRKALPPSAKPASLAALVDTLAFKNITVGECSYAFPKELLSRFAFFDLKGDRVSVRFSLSHYSEICRGQMTQIGIALPVTPGLKAELESGLLMADRTAAAKKAVTAFEMMSKAVKE